jgi:hypothetical protein
MDKLNDIAPFIFLLIALMIIFKGEPDLWDKWHIASMKRPEYSVTLCY